MQLVCLQYGVMHVHSMNSTSQYCVVHIHIRVRGLYWTNKWYLLCGVRFKVHAEGVGETEPHIGLQSLIPAPLLPCWGRGGRYSMRVREVVWTIQPLTYVLLHTPSYTCSCVYPSLKII